MWLQHGRRKGNKMKEYIKEFVKNFGFALLMAVVAFVTLYPIALTFIA